MNLMLHACVLAVSVLGAVADEDRNEVWEGWGSVILVAGISLTTLVIIGLLLWQLLKTWQASMESRATIAREEAYRKLAKESTESQERLADGQQRAAGELTEINARLTAIEKLLRDVE